MTSCLRGGSAGTDPVFTFTLGNPTNGNPPEFTLLGVGANSTAVPADLLLTNGAPPASGLVVRRRACCAP